LLLLAALILSAGCGGGDNPSAKAQGDDGPSVAQSDAETPAAGEQGTPADDPSDPPRRDLTTPQLPNQETPPSAESPAAEKLDTTYITDDFFAAVVVKPRRMIESKLVGKMTRRPEDAQMPTDVEEALDDLDEINVVRQAIVLLGPGPGGTPEGGFGPPAPKISGALIVRFDTAEACQEMLADGPPLGEQRTYGAKKYNVQLFGGGGSVEHMEVPTEQVDAQLAELKKRNADKAADPNVTITYETTDVEGGTTTMIEITTSHAIDTPTMPNARYMPDDKTVVFAREVLLKKMMDAEDAGNVESPLINRLKGLGDDHDLMAVVLGEAVREPLREFTSQMPPQMIPPPVRGLLQLVDGIQVVTVTAGADASPLATIEIEGEDAAAAEQIQKGLDPFLKMGQGSFAFVSQSAEEQAPAMMPLVDVAGDIVRDLSLQQRETRVVFTVPRPASLDEVDDWLGPIAETVGQASRQNRLRQIVDALQRALDSHQPLPRNIYAEGSDMPLLSWRVELLPMLGADELNSQFNRNESWDGENNKLLLEARDDFGDPLVYTRGDLKPGHTVYLTFQGEGAMIDGRKEREDIDLKDGISGTIAVIEVSPERAVPWTQPVDIDLSAPDVPTMLGPPPTPEGYPAVLFDGRIITLPPDIDVETLRKLAGFDNGVPPGYEPEL
jgi:hypothetical protein